MTYATELKQWKRKCLAEGHKKGLAEGLAEGLAKGLAKGEKKVREEKQETILNLAQIHMPKETIAQVTRSSIAYVEEVIQNAEK